MIGAAEGLLEARRAVPADWQKTIPLVDDFLGSTSVKAHCGPPICRENTTPRSWSRRELQAGSTHWNSLVTVKLTGNLFESSFSRPASVRDRQACSMGCAHNPSAVGAGNFWKEQGLSANAAINGRQNRTFGRRSPHTAWSLAGRVQSRLCVRNSPLTISCGDCNDELR
jgi:hypothetical protein